MDQENKIEEELGNDAATAQPQEHGNQNDNQNDNNKQLNEETKEQPKEKKVKQPKPEKPAKVKKEKKAKDPNQEVLKQILRKKRSKPVSFMSLFINEILFFIPILGFIPIIVSIIKPSCNKNIKTLAWTAIVWQFIMMGALVLFTYTKGVGYILGWLENELNIRLF